MNGWGTTAPFTRTADFTYEATIPLGAGLTQFKVASEDWSTYDFGKTSAVIVPGDSLTLDRAAGNITIDAAAAGNYRFLVSTATDITAPLLTVDASP
jgi:pullulanase